jgi:N-acetylglutamate synthase-like GNAT family acetyltransferase
MGGVKIRKLRREDASQIARIARAIDKTGPRLDFRRILEDQVWTTSGAGLVAEVEGKVVGYMIGTISSGSFGADKCAWIAQFGVDPKCMGQGIGQKLADRIFKIYRGKGVKTVLTSVKWDSTDILSFLKTLGFDRSEFINLHKTIEDAPPDARTDVR